MKKFNPVIVLIMLSGCTHGPKYSDFQGAPPYLPPTLGEKVAVISSTFEKGQVFAGKWAGIGAIDGQKVNMTEDKSEDITIFAGVHKTIFICRAGGSHALVAIDWAAEPSHHYKLECDRSMMRFPPGAIISVFDADTKIVISKGENDLVPDESISPIPIIQRR